MKRTVAWIRRTWLTNPVSRSLLEPSSRRPLTATDAEPERYTDERVARYTTTMTMGQSESDWQKGQTLTGRELRTKNAASALSGGARNPRITTGRPASRVAASENLGPSGPDPW